MIAVELQAGVDAIGNVQTFYLSDAPLTTLPIDNPANISFDPTLKDVTTETSVFADSQTTGNSAKSSGEIILTNIDGQYDAWLGYSFEGRNIVVRSSVINPSVYPGDYPIIVSGVVETISVTFEQVVITIKDRQSIFEAPALSNFYLGNNVLPNGLEGVDDLKGKPKAKLFGSVFNYAPDLVNSSKLTYQVNDGAVVSIVVKDRGVVLNNAGDYATSAQMQAVASLGMMGGSYITCLAEGYFRLSSAPAGKITVDVVQGAAPANRTASAILKTLALLAGVPSSAIDNTSFAAVDMANPASVGIAITGDATFTNAMDQIAGSIGMFYVYSPSGVLGVGILTVASTSANFIFARYDIKSIERRSAKDNNLPVKTAKVNYNLNYSPANNDLAGSVGVAQSAILSQQYLIEQASDLSITTQFQTADIIEVNTLLTTKADAANEAARLLSLYKVRRDIFEFVVPIDALPSQPLYLMASVALTLNRFALVGRFFRLLGVAYDIGAKAVTLTVWG